MNVYESQLAQFKCQSAVEWLNEWWAVHFGNYTVVNRNEPERSCNHMGESLK